MSKFASFHPIVNLIYFAVVIVISMVVMHPVFVAISVFCAFLYSVILKGFSSLKFSLGVIVPMAVLSVIINVLTNRNGVTLLTTLPFGIPVSREALIAGLCTAGVIASAVLWFLCFNAVYTNDKLVYIFGRIMPSLSVILSMVLRFVPQFKSQFKSTVTAQRCMGRDISFGRLTKRLKNLAVIMSVMMGKVLEGSIDTADSMKGRGFGLKGKTTFNVYKFTLGDFAMLLITAVLLIYITLNGAQYTYYPAFEMQVDVPATFIAFFLLCIIPAVMEIWEVLKWKYLISKI